MRDLMPSSVDGWKAVAHDGAYNRETLYDYIDGGAEVYLAYDLRDVASRKYAKPGRPDITLDMFDMGSPADAYGIFSFERESGSVGVGQDSEYAAGLLRFWKGRYFVSILADRETSSSRKAVMNLGKAVAARIKSTGARPAVLSYLPSSNLIPTETRFFHRESGLDYQYYLSDENILNLGSDTNVVLARYKVGDEKPRLLIVEYTDEGKATPAFARFGSAYVPDAQPPDFAAAKDGKWTAIRHKGRFIVVVFESPDKAYAVKLAENTLSKLEVGK
jgi:hypothetical protein